MDVLSLNELKSLCEKRKLPTSGSKEALMERLLKSASASRASGSSSSNSAAASAAGQAQPISTSASAVSSTLFPSEYEPLTMPQLKDLCRERMLPVGGIKDDLVARLNSSDPRKMSLLQLKDRCRDAGLPVTGTKADLTERVMKNMTSGTGATLQSKSVDELKELCREHSVPVTGKKEELIERIKQATAKPSKKTTEPSVSSKDQASASASGSALLKKKSSMPDYASMTIPQLKEICRERSLMVGGTKDEIIERLLQAPVLAPSSSSRPSSASGKRPSVVPSSTAASSGTADASYESMTVPQLKDLCRERTLPVMGNKDELLSRLTHHDDVIRTMFKRPKPTSSSPSTTAAVTGVKRSASTGEPKPKKVKTTATPSAEPKTKKPKTMPVAAQEEATWVRTPVYKARKSTGGKAPRVEPPQNTARKSPPEEWRPTPSGRYAVYSTFGHPSASSYPTFYESYISIEAANAHANDVFYEKIPWELHRLEIDDEDVQEDYVSDLLQLKLRSLDGVEWVVGVKDRGTASQDIKVKESSAEPKAKKAKTTPATTKEPKAKKASQTGSVARSPVTGRYRVYSTCAYPRDNFHTYAGPGEPTYYDNYDTVEAANQRVGAIFYSKNPWGLRQHEMDDLDIRESWKGALLKLSVCPPDSENWCVGVKDLGVRADKDGDVIMVSDSETEDEQY